MPWRGVDLNDMFATYGCAAAFFASVMLLDRFADRPAVLVAAFVFWTVHAFVWAFALPHVAANQCADTSFAPIIVLLADVVVILLVTRQSPDPPRCRT